MQVKIIFYLSLWFSCVLIDKRKPITGMGWMEYVMSQEQKYNLILSLVSQGVIDPDEIEKFINTVNISLFSKQ